LANGIGQKRVRNQWAPARRRWTKLGHDVTAVRDQHGFASGREPDVFAELIPKQCDADRPHVVKVATGSYFINRSLKTGIARADRPAASNAPSSYIDKSSGECRR